MILLHLTGNKTANKNTAPVQPLLSIVVQCKNGRHPITIARPYMKVEDFTPTYNQPMLLVSFTRFKSQFKLHKGVDSFGCFYYCFAINNQSDTKSRTLYITVNLARFTLNKYSK